MFKRKMQPKVLQPNKNEDNSNEPHTDPRKSRAATQKATTEILPCGHMRSTKPTCILYPKPHTHEPVTPPPDIEISSKHTCNPIENNHLKDVNNSDPCISTDAKNASPCISKDTGKSSKVDNSTHQTTTDAKKTSRCICKNTGYSSKVDNSTHQTTTDAKNASPCISKDTGNSSKVDNSTHQTTTDAKKASRCICKGTGNSFKVDNSTHQTTTNAKNASPCISKDAGNSSKVDNSTHQTTTDAYSSNVDNSTRQTTTDEYSYYYYNDAAIPGYANVPFFPVGYSPLATHSDILYSGSMSLIPQEFYSYNGIHYGTTNSYMNPVYFSNGYNGYNNTPKDNGNCYGSKNSRNTRNNSRRGRKRSFLGVPFGIDSKVSVLPDPEVLAANNAKLLKLWYPDRSDNTDNAENVLNANCDSRATTNKSPSYITIANMLNGNVTSNPDDNNGLHTGNVSAATNNNYLDSNRTGNRPTSYKLANITADNHRTVLLQDTEISLSFSEAVTGTASIPLNTLANDVDLNIPIINANLDHSNCSETNLEDLLLCDAYRAGTDDEFYTDFEPVRAGVPYNDFDITEPIYKHINYNFFTQVAKVASTSARGIVNLKERIRTSNLNDAYGSLRRVIPTTPDTKKLTKIEIVRLAMSYIAHLGIQIRLGTRFSNCSTSLMCHKNKRWHICPFCKGPAAKNDKNFLYQQQKCRYIYNKRRKEH